MNSQKIKLALLLLSAIVAIGSAYLMWTKPFWGHLPFFFFLSSWIFLMVALESKWFKHPEKKQLVFLSTLSGIILGFGFPSSPLTPLMFFGFVPLLLAERIISEEGNKIHKILVFKLCMNAFVIWNIISTFWVANTSFGPSLVAFLLNSVFMSVPIILYHVVKTRLKGYWPMLAFISFWICFEYGHMNWEISWPWLTLGNSFAQYPSWVQWYEWTGHLGGSVYILLINYLLFQVWYRGENVSARWKKGLVVLGITIVPIIISLVMYSGQTDQGEKIQVSIVQPNYEPHYQKFSIPKPDQMQRFLQLSEAGVDEDTDYLIFPETSFSIIDVDNGFSFSFMRQLRLFLRQHPNLKLISGLATMKTFDSNPGDRPALRTYVSSSGDTTFWELQNSAVELDGRSGDKLDVYIKSKLVPGAEIFPYNKILFFFEPVIAQLGGTTAGHAIQKERRVFQGGKAKVAPVICYESVYGEYVGEYIKKGADAIFIVTNDGWWDNTAGHKQHLKFACLRAIEHRRSIARSANTGTSCFINQRGDILQPTDYEVATVVKGEMALNQEMTFYSRYGDWIAKISGLLIILIFVMFWKEKFTNTLQG